MKIKKGYVVTDNEITVVVGRNIFEVSKSDASFSEVKNRIDKANFDGIEKLMTLTNPRVVKKSKPANKKRSRVKAAHKRK
jgi:hypothetical protein